MGPLPAAPPGIVHAATVDMVPRCSAVGGPRSAPADARCAGGRRIATCAVDTGPHASAHEAATQREIARRLARLLGGWFDADCRPGEVADVYWVPNDTVVGDDAARRLGLRGRHDLFGGCVPWAFVATKAITHPRVSPGALVPAGWSDAFARRVDDGTLAGCSAFTRADAIEAARVLLALGPVRLKPVIGTGGRGQRVCTDLREVEAALGAMAEQAFDPGPERGGVVVEQDLVDVETFSVGQLDVPGLVASYVGTQVTTPDNDGERGYGGSTLSVARGGFDAIAGRRWPAPVRAALAAARAYDEAAHACFPAFFASRRNYDVVVGHDARGRVRCGVLEQSWRVGGASPAEVVALAALRADPSLAAVRAGCVERFGAGHEPPPGAEVFYEGTDEDAGPLLKYAWCETDAHA
jgi:hypothetical protein